MPRVLNVRREEWLLRRPFTIARGTKTTAEVVVAEINEEGAIGRGECAPYLRYDETVASVSNQIEAQAIPIAAGMDRDELITSMRPGAARNALDCALWDLESKQRERRAWALAGLDEPLPVVTAETLIIDTPAEMAKPPRTSGIIPY